MFEKESIMSDLKRLIKLIVIIGSSLYLLSGCGNRRSNMPDAPQSIEDTSEENNSSIDNIAERIVDNISAMNAFKSKTEPHLWDDLEKLRVGGTYSYISEGVTDDGTNDSYRFSYEGTTTGGIKDELFYKHSNGDIASIYEADMDRIPVSEVKKEDKVFLDYFIPSTKVVGFAEDDSFISLKCEDEYKDGFLKSDYMILVADKKITSIKGHHEYTDDKVTDSWDTWLYVSEIK